jgi:hypothetical protein
LFFSRRGVLRLVRPFFAGNFSHPHMENEASADAQAPHQIISLQTISQNFLGAIQRQFDMLAFNLAAISTATQEQYESYSRQTKLMPVAQLHQPFAGVRDYARGLLLRQTVNDLASMASACVDNCHLLCQLVKNQAAKRSQTEGDKIVGEAHRAFVQCALNEKFEVLEKDFAIMCGTEDAIIAIAIGLRVLAARAGEVSADDVDENGELVFELKSVQVVPPAAGAAPGTKPEARVVDTRRTFRAGDRLELTNSELLGLSITVTAFFHDLFQAVDEYGMRALGNGAATGASCVNA